MKLITQTITLPERYSVPDSSNEARNELITRSEEITSITTIQENDSARAVAVDIRKHLKEVEAARTTLTKPLLDGQRLLKSLADEYIAPLNEELKRVERLATNYMEAEQRRVAAAEEQRRIDYEKAERDRISAEEKARKAAEKMTTNADMRKALKAEDKLLEAQAAVQTIISAPLPEANRAKGQTMKRIMKWEVMDINALAKARPDLCRIEPKASAIQAVCVPEMPNLPPGLKLWWENQATFTTR